MEKTTPEEGAESAGESPLEPLRRALRAFARERAWEPFHTPKNLAMALSVEVAELLEPFQWLTPEQSRALTPAQRAALAEEVGDVFIYLTMLADRFGIDPLQAAHAKLEKNREKYPAERARGRSDKYTAYAGGE